MIAIPSHALEPSAPIRIGIVGAARIAPRAIIQPARTVPGATVVAVAARNIERAKAFATTHQIPHVYKSYADLIASPNIDAVYIPLPNNLHCEWSIRAMQAGKHVLCEKPIAANQTEAQQMAAVASQTGKLLVEAFHYRYHPLALRMKEIVTSGELGKIHHIESHLCLPIVRPGDIRFRYDLAGGATMDTGCYVIHIARYLAGREPQVTRAHSLRWSPQLDRYMEADLDFGNGTTGQIVCSILSRSLLRIQTCVSGEKGTLRVLNPILPHYFHRLTIEGPNATRTEQLNAASTYTYQLRAFVQAIHNGIQLPTGPSDAIANMKVIDDVYTAAGMNRRGTQ